MIQQQQQQKQRTVSVTRQPPAAELILLVPVNRLELLEESSGLFECRVKGNNLNIQWLKGNQPLENSNKHKMSYDEQSGLIRLFIGEIVQEDGGYYTCQISNQVGSIATTSSLVIVRKNPKKNFILFLLF